MIVDKGLTDEETQKRNKESMIEKRIRLFLCERLQIGMGVNRKSGRLQSESYFSYLFLSFFTRSGHILLCRGSTSPLGQGCQTKTAPTSIPDENKSFFIQLIN